MGKTRLFAVIVAFLIVAILAVLLLPGGDAQPVQEEKSEKLTAVVAARVDIPAFTVITADMVFMKDVPESSVHTNYISSLDDVIGKKSLVAMVSNEVIMLNHIIDLDAPQNRLACNISSGMRAVTVPVDDISGVCDQIRAGDHVDVIVAVQDVRKNTSGYPGVAEAQGYQSANDLNSGRAVSVVLLQDIKVLALDQDMQYAPKQQDTGLYSYRTVTLEVLPEDSAKLDWAQYEGKIYLALRGEDDTGLIEPAPYGAEKALQNGGV